MCAILQEFLSRLQNSLSLYKFISGVLCALILEGCAQERLSVQNHYISYKNLASYQVGTPDPCKKCPDYGHQLLITWSIPEEWLEGERLFLNLDIRFEDKTQENFSYPLTVVRGLKEYRLLNDAYDEKGGILSYKVEIVREGEVLETRHHHLWTEVIELENLP